MYVPKPASWMIAAGTALLMTVGLAGVASPAPSAETTTADDVVVIDGVEYPVTTQVEQYEVVSGAADVTRDFGDIGLGRATWGSSYAISKELVQLHYTGTACAAGNLYNGQRIVQVCIWYTRDGVMKSSKVCSTADTVNGTTWYGGSIVSTSCWDSLNPSAPQTIFNIAVSRYPGSV